MWKSFWDKMLENNSIIGNSQMKPAETDYKETTKQQGKKKKKSRVLSLIFHANVCVYSFHKCKT